MSDDALLPVNEQPDPRSLAILPAGGPEQAGGDWNGLPAFAQPAASAGLLGPELMVYLHAFRRHWLLSLGLGLVLATLTGLAVWFGIGNKYTASAFLMVNMQDRSVLSGQLTTMDRDRFEIFKNQQENQLQQRFVLLAALRKPEVTKTRTVQEEQQRGGDVVGRLQGLLSVGFPGKAETMQVSIARSDPHEAAVLVNAVVEAYLSEIVGNERDQKQKRYNQLVTACAAKDEEIRKTRQELKSLAQLNGTSTDPETITQKQRLLLDDYSVYHQQLARTEFEVADFEGQLGAQEALLKSVENGMVPAEEVDMLAVSDPVTRELAMQLAIKKQEQVINSNVTSTNSKSRYSEHYKHDLDNIQQLYNEKIDEFTKKVRERKHMLVETEVVKLKSLLNIKRQQYDVLVKQVEKLKQEAANFGSSTVDIEMGRSNLKLLEAVYAELNSNREKIKVELDSAPRITLVEPAEDPLLPSNWLMRTALTIMAVLASFCCPAAVAILWDAPAAASTRPTTSPRGCGSP